MLKDVRRRGWLVAGGAIVVLGAVPVRSTGYLLHVLTTLLLFGLMAEGWRLLGWADLGAALFFGLGGYAAALITGWLGLPMLGGLLAAALLGGVVATIEGLAFTRRGWIGPVVSLALVPAAGEITLRWVGLTGGAQGLSLPAVSDRVVYWGLLVSVIAAVAVAWRRNAKAWPLAGGAFLALGGGLHAASSAFVDAGTVFDPGISLEVLTMALLVRVGGPFGPLIGAALLTGLGELLNAYAPSAHLPALAGLLILSVLIGDKRGRRTGGAWRSGITIPASS
ncbi:MAG: hypothetical protein JO247_02580 [Chloroflexi bacterium]|nr:hypothetical protein [Chloroflexota bacterium]